ncbi:hypothetical protein BCR36DRAFT_370338 [Piromyces finnis]|uniref:Uncharacterized protein n=1 Tax=Piromyces finnis TaxID=1754191 RepID=A0A1Y1V9C5_9FUNG|nr:hypothetical protein BCR36DRAFT_370338 [Piromyces finnis]|eukprot:ORX50310.1 hypothetical protein BCR36DRAFT_370338 [Piromyces finnis]
MTETLPYLSKIISNQNHILNREIKNSDKQFLNYVNNYTNPRNNENWWNNLVNGYQLMPGTMNSNSLDDEIGDSIENKMDDDNENSHNQKRDIKFLSENLTLSSNNDTHSNNNHLFSNFNTRSSKIKYYNHRESNNYTGNNNSSEDKVDLFEINDDDIEEID